MAVLRDLVSFLLVCISFHAVTGACTPGPKTKTKKGDDKPSFSRQCGATIGTVSVKPEIQTCTNFGGLFPIHSAEGNFSTPIKDWITGMCAAKPCTEQALKLAISDLKDGCKAELTNQAPSTGALFSIFSHYKDIRDTSCKNTDKLDFCEPSLLDTVENLKHTKRAFFTVSASAYCSECRKKNADKPNPPTKRSESDPKEKPDVCSGTAAALEKKSVTIGLPNLKKGTSDKNTPSKSSKGPKESSKSEDKPGKGEKSTSQNPPKSEKSDDKLKSAEGPEIKPENGVKIDTSTNQDSSSKPKPGNGENTGAAAPTNP
ncbi:hypothetical protein Pst134EA_017427 [Puccinia striiformis f. sp. tritici]|uniref:hypothetical protein n=1 Tax=Puccinia striiformis f. sp. tritici TaxID=168172 RepID=UPI002007FC4D|nr:hypothetical protein Pst134EA_017427 [Puccinia striiformis f. sp. tritici]KAH9461117.1 hypothetical protein Pst134EA_017427 [Puccinia striiformis f. sp. tritici]